MVTEISVSPATVWRILREEHIQPLRLLRVQCLKDDDYSHNLHFCEVDVTIDNEQFPVS